MDRAATATVIDTLPASALSIFLKGRPNRTVFLEHEVKELLASAGLVVPKGFYIPREEGAVLSLIEGHHLSYPLVAKVSSSKLASKSDVHGVVPGVQNAVELRAAVDRLSAIKGAEGVLIEEMAPQGVEVIIGGVMDRQFGPVVMFGLGGVFVELFRDIAFGLAPLSPDDARGLISRVKGSRLLQGYRGKPPADMSALARILATVSEFIATGLLEEIDLNPVAVYTEGACILDAKMKVL